MRNIEQNTYYYDIIDIIPISDNMTNDEKTFIKAYLNKIKIDVEEDELIDIALITPLNLGYFILDVVRSYPNNQQSFLQII